MATLASALLIVFRVSHLLACPCLRGNMFVQVATYRGSRHVGRVSRPAVVVVVSQGWVVWSSYYCGVTLVRYEEEKKTNLEPKQHHLVSSGPGFIMADVPVASVVIRVVAAFLVCIFCHYNI
jgi:hypothetical protein